MPLVQFESLGIEGTQAKIHHLLQILKKFKKVSGLEQLAVITQIRMEIELVANQYDDYEQYTDPVCQILFNTELRNTFMDILQSVELD